MKVAIIHYWFITRRGGEKVVESILKLYPKADVYTLFYDKDSYGNTIENHRIYTSKYNNSFFRKHYQKLFPLYPRIVKSLQLKDNYDLIISSESGPSKGIKITDNTKHICYIHSPMRYCWGFTNDYLNTLHPFLRPFANFFFKRLRKWDYKTKDNVQLYIANSKNVAERVRKFYHRNSEVIYPPISTKLFEKPLKENKKNHFLSFGAITPYKRIDLLVDCFNKNGEKLVIIGEGSEKDSLQKKARENIEFKGYLKDSELEKYIRNARALIFPGEEDFGMIPLEVMALGIPVLAFSMGGALETVVENRNDISKSSGIFFNEQNVISLQKCLDYFYSVEEEFDPLWIRKHSKSFEETLFLEKFKAKVDSFLKKN